MRRDKAFAIVPPMRSIICSIIALAGAIIFSAASLNGYGDTMAVVCLTGALIGAIGFLLLDVLRSERQ